MRLIFLALLVISTVSASSQISSMQLPMLDKSPMDMSYYPNNYPILKIQDKATEPLVMRIVYGRPQLNGRKVFGDLQEFGKVWRLGANEATEIEFFKDVKIDGKKVKKGRYTVYAIVYRDKWTFIFNKDTDVWGSFKYDQSKDVMRADAPVVKSDITEVLTIFFNKTSTGADMVVYWEDIKVSLPIQF